MMSLNVSIAFMNVISLKEDGTVKGQKANMALCSQLARPVLKTHGLSVPAKNKIPHDDVDLFNHQRL